MQLSENDENFQNGDTSVEMLSTEYWLVIDKVPVEKADNLLQALQLLLASYFVFNKNYPSEVASFLEFAQMKFLNLYTNISRSKSKATTDKVNTLIRKINSVVAENIIETN